MQKMTMRTWWRWQRQGQSPQWGLRDRMPSEGCCDRIAVRGKVGRQRNTAEHHHGQVHSQCDEHGQGTKPVGQAAHWNAGAGEDLRTYPICSNHQHHGCGCFVYAVLRKNLPFLSLCPETSHEKA